MDHVNVNKVAFKGGLWIMWIRWFLRVGFWMLLKSLV